MSILRLLSVNQTAHLHTPGLYKGCRNQTTVPRNTTIALVFANLTPFFMINRITPLCKKIPVRDIENMDGMDTYQQAVRRVDSICIGHGGGGGNLKCG